MDWNLDSSRPIWPQLEEQLKRMIVAGQFPPGEQFPTVRELAEDAKVNPNTMQRALTELEREGLLYTQRTSGRFVSEDAGMIEGLKRSGAEQKAREFYLEMVQNGLSADEIRRLLEKAIAEETKQ